MNYADMLGVGNALEGADARKREAEAFALKRAIAQSEMARNSAQTGMEQQRLGLETQRANDASKLAVPTLALQQNKVTELPAEKAKSDLEMMMKLDPTGYINNPQAVELAKTAGTPMQQADLQTPRWAGIQSSVGNQSIPSTEQVATKMGASPQTGVMIPDSIKTVLAGNKMKQTQDDLVMDALKKYLQPEQPQADPAVPPQANVAPNAPPIAPMASHAQQSSSAQLTNGLPPVAQRVVGQTYTMGNGKPGIWKGQGFAAAPNAAPPPSTGGMPPSISGMTPPGLDKSAVMNGMVSKALGLPIANRASPQETYNNTLARITATNNAGGKLPPATEQRAYMSANNAKQDYSDAMQQLAAMFPGIEQEAMKVEAASGGDPQKAQAALAQAGGLKYNGAMDTIKMFGHKKEYDPISSMGLGRAGPYTKLMQSGYLGNVNGLVGLLPGTRAIQASEQLVRPHQPQLGYESPLASYLKLKYMHDIGLQRVLDEVLHPVGMAPAAQPPADSQ